MSYNPDVSSHIFTDAGRRKLLLVSLAGITVALMLLGVSFEIGHRRNTPLSNNDNSCMYSTCWDCVARDHCGYCPSPTAGNAFGAEGACLYGNNTVCVLAQLFFIHSYY